MILGSTRAWISSSSSDRFRGLDPPATWFLARHGWGLATCSHLHAPRITIPPERPTGGPWGEVNLPTHMWEPHSQMGESGTLLVGGEEMPPLVAAGSPRRMSVTVRYVALVKKN
jgi:hypothetical protein